jgi:S-adenosylmethionine hydrolase
MIGSALSSTFHGRDIFSPVGAHLARGEDPAKVGPALGLTKLVRLAIRKAALNANGISATVIGTDGPFGNLVTNVNREDFAKLGYALGEKVKFTVAGKPLEIPFVKTFSDVPVGSPLFYIDSRGHLGLAVNQSSFVKRYGVVIPRMSRLTASMRGDVLSLADPFRISTPLRNRLRYQDDSSSTSMAALQAHKRHRELDVSPATL